MMAGVALATGLLILLPILFCGDLLPLPRTLRRLAESGVGGKLLVFLVVAAVVMIAMVLIDIGSGPKREPKLPDGHVSGHVRGNFAG